jgi:hypothetical protein
VYREELALDDRTLYETLDGECVEVPLYVDTAFYDTLGLGAWGWRCVRPRRVRSLDVLV